MILSFPRKRKALSDQALTALLRLIADQVWASVLECESGCTLGTLLEASSELVFLDFELLDFPVRDRNGKTEGDERDNQTALFDWLLFDQTADFNRLVSIGSVRMRLPVAAKMALVTAGATAAVGASPKPPGGAVLLTKYVSMCGASLIRIDG